jgi:hypothetical protein
LTVELFVPHLVEPHYIAVFRNPTEVAKSLKVRNGFDLSKGIALAKEYNQRILDFLNKVW